MIKMRLLTFFVLLSLVLVSCASAGSTETPVPVDQTEVPTSTVVPTSSPPPTNSFTSTPEPVVCKPTIPDILRFTIVRDGVLYWRALDGTETLMLDGLPDVGVPIVIWGDNFSQAAIQTSDGRLYRWSSDATASLVSESSLNSRDLRNPSIVFIGNELYFVESNSGQIRIMRLVPGGVPEVAAAFDVSDVAVSATLYPSPNNRYILMTMEPDTLSAFLFDVFDNSLTSLDLKLTSQNVQWVPDGSAFFGTVFDPATLSLAGYIVDAATVSKLPVPFPEKFMSAAWNPNGSTLMLILNGNVYFYDRATAALTQKTNGVLIAQAVWLNTNELLTLRANKDNKTGSYGRVTEGEFLQVKPEFSENLEISAARLTTNGRYILFDTYVKGITRQVMRVDTFQNQPPKGKPVGDRLKVIFLGGSPNGEFHILIDRSDQYYLLNNCSGEAFPTGVTQEPGSSFHWQP